MSVPEIQSVWNIISKYTFDIEDESINEDLKCVICKNLSIDAVVSNICGCSFCNKCITEYTKEANNYCPGGKEYCHDVNLILGEYTSRSPMINKRISHLKVNCPNDSCESKVVLLEMENHLKTCTKQPIECPYLAIGCEDKQTSKDSLETHLHIDAFIHSKLLINLIINLKNDVDSLREELRNSKLEIASLQDESMERENKIVKLEEELRRESGKIVGHKLEIEAVRIELGYLTTNCTINKLEIATLKEDLKNKENRILSLEEQLRESRNDVAEERIERNREFGEQRRQIEEAKIGRENVATMVNELRQKIDGMTEEEIKENKMNEWIKLCPNIGVDFIWRFDQCSKRINRYFYSESFYSNNYKLCLGLNISSGDNIYLHCYLMKGDNDEKVPWPMKRSVTLTIVDQVTHKSCKSSILSTSFIKPTCDISSSVCMSPYVLYSSIKDNPSVVVNDSIVVSCGLSDP